MQVVSILLPRVWVIKSQQDSDLGKVFGVSANGRIEPTKGDELSVKD